MNLGLWRVWHAEREVELLAQTYDSITFQVDATRGQKYIDDKIGRVLELIKVELVAPRGRKYSVPGEAKIGWNWGSRVTEEDRARARASGRKPGRLNLGGLVKWKAGMELHLRPEGGLRRIMG